MKIQTFSTMFGGKELTIETGRYAERSNASCTIRYGDTMLLVTAVMSKEAKPGMHFFPLMVDYEEKLYAAGRIKGSRFIKREGRPTDEAVLTSRFIDRAIRPLFPEGMRNEVQIIITVLSFDGENDPDILGLIGASCVLHMSNIPWNGPISAVRVSRLGEEWIINPTYAQREDTKFDLDIAGTPEKVIMVEARANEAKDDELAEAFKRGMKEFAPIIKLLEEIRKTTGDEKIDVFALKDDQAKEDLQRKKEVEAISLEFLKAQMDELFFSKPKATKSERETAKIELKNRLETHLTEKELEEDAIKIGTDLIYDFIADEASRLILEDDKRIDGRRMNEVRALNIEVGIVPRVHGVGHFMRGETQALSIVTLGGPGDKQILDGMETVGEKRYMHHYNFPPFSVGEAKFLRGAGRREIGHGALAEKALEPMLPSLEDFPYTIRVVSETLNSNGSSSMASTCGSTMALMDAGVPIKKPVAGVAIGLASRGDDWKVITDIQDIEDGKGGMDFKVTGTKDGVTAIQMDTKTKGVTLEILVEALKQATEGRLIILEEMLKVLPAPRPELSKFAPRILSLNIDPEKIREVIGPGGKMINEIIDTTGVDNIDIEQDGLIMITSVNAEAGERALAWIEDLVRDAEVGKTYDGKVVRLMDFGAFVEILPGKDGMVHVSELAPWRVEKVGDIVKLNDEIKVKVIEIDSLGRINLSMKQAEGNVYTDAMKAKASKPTSRPARKPFKKNDK